MTRWPTWSLRTCLLTVTRPPQPRPHPYRSRTQVLRALCWCYTLGWARQQLSGETKEARGWSSVWAGEGQPSPLLTQAAHQKLSRSDWPDCRSLLQAPPQISLAPALLLSGVRVTVMGAENTHLKGTELARTWPLRTSTPATWDPVMAPIAQWQPLKIREVTSHTWTPLTGNRHRLDLWNSAERADWNYKGLWAGSYHHPGGCGPTSAAPPSNQLMAASKPWRKMWLMFMSDLAPPPSSWLHADCVGWLPHKDTPFQDCNR